METTGKLLAVYPMGCGSTGTGVLVEGLTPKSTVKDFIEAYRKKTGVCCCLYRLILGPPKNCDVSCGKDDLDTTLEAVGVSAEAFIPNGKQEAPMPPPAGTLIVSGRMRGNPTCDVCGKDET